MPAAAVRVYTSLLAGAARSSLFLYFSSFVFSSSSPALRLQTAARFMEHVAATQARKHCSKGRGCALNAQMRLIQCVRTGPHPIKRVGQRRALPLGSKPPEIALQSCVASPQCACRIGSRMPVGQNLESSAMAELATPPAFMFSPRSPPLGRRHFKQTIKMRLLRRPKLDVMCMHL